MVNLFDYLSIPLILIALAYSLYDRWITAPRDHRSTLSRLEGFQEARVLQSTEGLLALDFELQRIAIINRKASKILDIAEIRDAVSRWTNMPANGVMIEKDFYVLFTVADINNPEIKVSFRSRAGLATCLEAVKQMVERRSSDVLEQECAVLKNNRRHGVAVVLTAIETETRSVLSHLDREGTDSVAGTIFHRGVFHGIKGDWTVSVAEVGPRNMNAGITAERAFQAFKPDIAFFIGIAGGIKDVRLGDVVAATKIYSYQSGKKTKLGFISRPDINLTSYALEQQAREVCIEGKWLSRLKMEHGNLPSAFVGPIAAGDVLIGSSKSDTALRIKNYYSDAIAAEMEGHGFLSALHMNPSAHGMVIRGISDLFDRKTEADAAGWQSFASDSAAAFAFEMLSQADIHENMAG